MHMISFSNLSVINRKPMFFSNILQNKDQLCAYIIGQYFSSVFYTPNDVIMDITNIGSSMNIVTQITTPSSCVGFYLLSSRL